MYDMHDPNGSSVEYNYDHSAECKNNGIRLVLLILELLMDDQAKG